MLLRKGTHPVWGAFMLVWVLGWLGLDLYWLFTESGLVRTLATWEAELLGGKWLPKLTTLVLFLAQLGVLLAVKVAIEAATGRRLTARIE